VEALWSSRPLKTGIQPVFSAAGERSSPAA
jgi:hypothetical protein